MFLALLVASASCFAPDLHTLAITPAQPVDTTAEQARLPFQPEFSVTDGVLVYNGSKMKYQYFAGYLNEDKSKIFRVLFASLGTLTSNDSTWPDTHQIGIVPPASSPGNIELKFQQLRDSATNDLDEKIDGYTFELLGGWTAVEFVDVRQGAAQRQMQDEIVKNPAKEAIPRLLPIPWRFITTDGMRTGANSSMFFSTVTPTASGKLDVLCFSEEGSVVYAPLKYARPNGQPAGNNDKQSASVPLDPSKTAKLLRASDPKDNDSTKFDNTAGDSEGFLKQARDFFTKVKDKHKDQEDAALR